MAAFAGWPDSLEGWQELPVRTATLAVVHLPETPPAVSQSKNTAAATARIGACPPDA
jgi:hypothetical protein